MKALLLSAYAARSHRHWQSAVLSMLPDWDWCELNLPPRYFSWRIRGNAMTWSVNERALLDSPRELLLATSMVDLATLRGLVPALTDVPTVVYFHENQFAYPPGGQRYSPLEAQVTSIYTAMAADRLLFNSKYNRDTFMAGTDELLRKMPDMVPLGIEASLRAKSAVLPVPFDSGLMPEPVDYWPSTALGRPDKPLRLLWVGRFEHDKGGVGLLRTLEHLEAAGLHYELAVTGEQFRQSPPEFEQIRTRFKHRLVHFGFLADESQYRGIQAAADIVLSTALHEFQGLALMGAVALGCLPVVPGRLVYPEIYGEPWCYPSLPDHPVQEAAGAADRIITLASGDFSAPDVSAFTRQSLLDNYTRELSGVAWCRDGQ